MKVTTDTLIWDKYVYPRKNKSNKTIEAYTEAMGIGAEFPPIEVQQVSIIDRETGEITEPYIILDGVHRWHAYQERKAEEVEVIEWQQGKILDYEEYKIQLSLEAAERNTRHGDRLTDGDKKDKARQIATDDPEGKWAEEQIAQKLNTKQQRVNEWISDIRQRQKASRDSVIVRLSRLGWTHDEIASITPEIERPRITQIVNNTDFGNINNLLAEGRDMDYIADNLHVDMALAWALRLDGIDDYLRFNGGVSVEKERRELGWGLRMYDHWYFNDCDKRFGDDWPGRIPAQLIAHTLYFFTKQGDLVLDPMAGGGVVPDTCLAFNRRCRAFDIATRKERPEIQDHYWELGNMKWPESLTQGYGKKPDLIFFDPPYYTKKEEEYKEKAGENGATPISSLSRDEYLAFFAEFFKLALKDEYSKPTTRLAFLNADWRDFQSTQALDESPDNAINIFHYGELLTQAGWQITHIIDSEMSSQRFNGAIAKQMQLGKILGTTRRTLLIARKAQ